MSCTIVWFRRDLRITDNPALVAAAKRGAVMPVFVWAPEEEAPWSPGGADRWWLHQSLTSLDASLRELGSRLTVCEGPAMDALSGAIRKSGADAVYWNRCYEPAIIERDKGVKATLREEGLEAKSFNGSLLFEPWEVANKAGGPYKVFTPFWKACQASSEPSSVLPTPRSLQPPKHWPSSLKLADLRLEPTIDWAAGLRETWTPGEGGARHRLEHFLDETVGSYQEMRDFPSTVGTSRLSPHLHHGEVSPRQVWHAVREHLDRTRGRAAEKSGWGYLRQLVWREFAHHLLYHFPHTPDTPLRENYGAFPWREDRAELEAWQKGETGYPIVDAGMRELWHTGWMHNRVRMITASFLVKDLLISWTEGATWFWDTLVDADLANNTLGWQWVGGCGADAAPYFRIFNPVLQAKKFDGDGDYVRRWVPELAALPTKHLHAPWGAPEDELTKAGVSLGSSYSEPIVDHAEARERALGALATISK